MPSFPLSVFQIKAGIRNPDRILPKRNETGVTALPVTVAGRRIGDLYASSTRPQEPRWLRYLTPYVEVRDLRLRTSSASAVVLVPAGPRLYALTFGHGHTLLADDALEERFGLRVTLNSIDEDAVRAIDHRRLDVIPRLTREQLDREAGVRSFGLDVERDLLRAVVGKPRDPTLGRRLAGSNRLVVSEPPSLEGLVPFLVRLGEIAERNTYAADFPWVDNLHEVRDATLSDELWKGLLDRLKRGEEHTARLTIPEIVDWSKVDHFRYANARGAPQHVDVDLAEYMVERVPMLEGLAERAQSDHVFGWNTESDAATTSWSIRRCLIAEAQVQDLLFVLNDGKWYQVSRDFVAEVSEAIDVIGPTAAPLPDYAGEKEDIFNRALADRDRATRFLVHPQTVTMPRRGRLEPCDVYSTQRIFMHVKISGGSGATSYLFSQGVNSAQLFAQHRGFRLAFCDLLPATHRWQEPERQPVPADYEIAYVVLGRGGGAGGLPFFGRLNLRNALQHLTPMGYRVTLTTLPITGIVRPALPRPRPRARRVRRSANR